MKEKKSFNQIKKEATKIAIQLGYGKDAVKRINKAKTESEIQRALITERKKRCN